ncbi:putative glycosyltransferase EpsH [mine drainage metagenome]|uniref:Putative glycosyltransferase EpsH n=1 Tax=mine drainage metagenome TaxID=410659 RepID=A0A1J5RFF8_9ZZZZ
MPHAAMTHPHPAMTAASPMPNRRWAAASDIEVSVIVCTRNRARQLVACLNHFRRQQTVVRWELLIVDNGSTDATRSVADAFIADLDVPACTLSEPTRGNGAGRNAGIAWARGQVIGFTDDDCYVAHDYVEQLARTFRTHAVDYIAGRILLFDPDDAPVTIAESTVPRDVPAHQPVPGAFIQGANMAFRRAALLKQGGFDPVFGAGARFAGEDWEVAMRVSDGGGAGRYEPAVVVWHHHGRKLPDVPALWRFYLIGEGAMYAKTLLHSRFKLAILKMMFLALRRQYTWRPTRPFLYLVRGFIQYLALRAAPGLR